MKMPTHLEKAKVYNADNNMELMGLAKLTLPNFEKTTVTLEGFGLMGKVEKPATGSIESSKLSLEFRGITKENLSLLEGVVNLDIRGAQSVYDTSLKQKKIEQFRVAVTGETTTYDLGEAQQPGTFSVKADIEIYNIEVFLDKKSQIKIDKFNDIYTVGGTDMLKDIMDAIG
jgi:phage tail tube protein FII